MAGPDTEASVIAASAAPPVGWDRHPQPRPVRRERHVIASPRHPRRAAPRRRDVARAAGGQARGQPDGRPPAAPLTPGVGLVDRRTVRHGVGRPRHLYDVTPDAQVAFPSNYDGFAAGLMAAIGMVGGDDLVGRGLRRPAEADRPADEGPPHRAAARERAARGPRPRAGRHPGRAGLPVERGHRRGRDDPAPAVQLRDLRDRLPSTSPCEAELALFQEVLGAEVVREIAHRLRRPALHVPDLGAAAASSASAAPSASLVTGAAWLRRPPSPVAPSSSPHVRSAGLLRPEAVVGPSKPKRPLPSCPRASGRRRAVVVEPLNAARDRRPRAAAIPRRSRRASSRVAAKASGSARRRRPPAA